MSQVPTIDRLLKLAADSPDSVLTNLRAHPQVAAQQDAHGYSLLHAAASYGHLELLKALVQELNVDPNLTDEDGETCLFAVESVDMAKEVLILGTKIDATNGEGQTAAEKLDDEDEQPLVAAFLREAAGMSTESAGASGSTEAALPNGHVNGESLPNGSLPNGAQINMGLMQQGEEGGEPDPEIRRRIDELAARPDFESDEVQAELRELVTQVISGMAEEGQGSGTRRRVD